MSHPDSQGKRMKKTLVMLVELDEEGQAHVGVHNGADSELMAFLCAAVLRQSLDRGMTEDQFERYRAVVRGVDLGQVPVPVVIRGGTD